MTIDKLITILGWRQEGIDEARDAQARLERMKAGAAAVAAGFVAVGGAMTAASGFAVKAATDWETAFTGVIKTVDATDAQLRILAGDLREMALTDVPIDVEELAGVAEAAGQLGIQTQHISDFTEVMAMLGVTTNLTAEDAAVMMARFANVSGLSPEAYDNLGAVIVDLGNNMATTEAEILTMGSRLVGAGTQIGLTEPTILGIAAALTSVGIQAEMGGSAFSRIMLEIDKAVAMGGDKLEVFAQVVGMTAQEFQQFYAADPEQAITGFITGLGGMMEAGENTHPVLEALDLDAIRVGDTLRRSAQAGDLFSGAIRMANEAFIENTALQREADLRFGTTRSQLQFLKNSVKDLGIEIGTALLPIVRDLIGVARDIIARFKEWVQENPRVVRALAAMGPVLLGIGVAIGGLVGAMSVLSVVSLPVLLGVTAAVALLGGSAMLLAAHWETAGPVIEERTGAIRDAWNDATASMNALLGTADEDPLSERMTAWEFLAQGLAGTFRNLLYPVQLVLEAVGDLIDLALRAEEITWERGDRQLAGALRRQGLSGVELRQFMAENPDVTAEDFQRRRPPESAAFAVARQDLLELLGMRGPNRTRDLLAIEQQLTPETFGGRDTEAYQQYLAILDRLRDAAEDMGGGTVRYHLRRVAEAEDMREREGRAFLTDETTGGTQVQEWLRARDAQRAAAATPAVPAEPVPAVPAATPGDATATASTPAGAPAPPAVPAPAGGVPGPPVASGLFSTAQVGELAGAINDELAALVTGALPAGSQFTPAEVREMLMAAGATPEQIEAAIAGPAAVVEPTEADVALRAVPELQIGTALIDQLVLTSSPVPIEQVIRPAEEGGIGGPGAVEVVPPTLDPITGEVVAPEIDPITGEVVPPTIDPLTGEVVPPDIDPLTGEIIPPELAPITGEVVPPAIDPLTGEVIPPDIDPITGEITPPDVDFGAGAAQPDLGGLPVAPLPGEDGADAAAAGPGAPEGTPGFLDALYVRLAYIETAIVPPITLGPSVLPAVAPPGPAGRSGSPDIKATFYINGGSAADGQQIGRDIANQLEHLRRRFADTEKV